MKITQCKKWSSIPVEKCEFCTQRKTQQLRLFESTFGSPKIVNVCNEHFLSWLNGLLDIQTQSEKKADEKAKKASMKY